MQKVRVRVAGREFELDRGGVQVAVQGVLAEPLRDHYVVVEGRRFPPKQVLALLTGLDRADFTTHQARSVLRRLGFLAGRLVSRGDGAPAPQEEGMATDEAEELRPHRGRWVALGGGRVLVAADSPGDVLSWLERHNLRADSLFRVPLDPSRDQAATLS